MQFVFQSLRVELYWFYVLPRYKQKNMYLFLSKDFLELNKQIARWPSFYIKYN